MPEAAPFEIDVSMFQVQRQRRGGGDLAKSPDRNNARFETIENEEKIIRYSLRNNNENV